MCNSMDFFSTYRWANRFASCYLPAMPLAALLFNTAMLPAIIDVFPAVRAMGRTPGKQALATVQRRLLLL